MSVPTLAVYPLVQRGIKDKSIGSGYDPTQTYPVDALIYKGGKIYIANQGDITGPWNPALWDEVDILSILEEVMSRSGSLSSIGRYLSDWNCQTGLPTTNPGEIPYSYITGDYYIVSNVTTGINYMPAGSSYTGAASTTVDFGNPQMLDMYRYDGTTWTLLHFGNAFIAFLSNYYTKSEADTRYAGKLVLTAAENKTVNGYLVPKLTDTDLTTIYNAVVAGKSVVIADATEMMFFGDVNADVVSNEIFVSFRYFDKMVIEYGENNATTFVNLHVPEFERYGDAIGLHDWNQLVANNIFSDSSAWSQESGVTATFANNVCTLVTTVAHNGIYRAITPEIGHKYYFSLRARGSVAFRYYINGAVSFPVSAAEYQKCSTIYTANSDNAFSYYLTGDTAGTLELTDFMIIDLTKIFGAGNEPTKEDFEKLFPSNYYPYCYFKRVNAWKNAAMTTSLSYTGLSITIPKGCYGNFALYAVGNNSTPQEIAVAYKTTGGDSIIAQRSGRRLSFFADSRDDSAGGGDLTVYVLARYAAAGNNNINLLGYIRSL